MAFAATVIRKRTIAPDTLAITLTRPEGFSFRAGQYATITLPGFDDGYVREFSIASAPHENYLEFAMRIRDSAFKRAVAALQHGAMVRISEPSGQIRSHEDSRNELWIVGGIGIAPLRSILRAATENDYVPPAIVIHSNSSNEAPYAEEFQSVAALNAQFRYLLIHTRGEHSGKRIDIGQLLALAPDLRNRWTTIIGTRPFVAAMREMLTKLGAPKEQVRWERFCGYTTHTKYELERTHSQQIPSTHRIT